MLRTLYLAVALVCLTHQGPLFAVILKSGDVQPEDLKDGDDVTVAQGSSNGDTSVGYLFVTEGDTFSSGDATIGQRQGARGFVTVENRRSTWSVDDITIGSQGTGDVTIQDSGQLRVGDDMTLGASATGHGTLNVANLGTAASVKDHLLLNAGRVNVTDRAWLTAQRATVGNRNGMVVVNNEALFDVGNEIRVGADGRGEVIVQGGGTLRAQNMGVGGPSSALVKISGPSSSVQLGSALTLGSNGPGSALVADQSLLAASRINVNDGSLELDGGTVNANIVELSANGSLSGNGRIEAWLQNNSGTVQVVQGQQLHFTRGTSSRDHVNAASVSVIGGEIAFDRSVSNTAQIAGRDAIYRFNGGVTNQVGSQLAFSSGDSDVFGAVENLGTITLDGVSTTTFYGPVNSVGDLNMTPDARGIFLGGLTISAQNQLGVPAPPANADGFIVERLEVKGALTAQGSLDVDLAELGSVENPGDSVTVDLLSASQILGSFATVSFDGQAVTDFVLEDDGRSFRAPSAAVPGAFDALTYSPRKLQFSRFITLPGDADGDREVGFSDFLVLSANFNMEGDWDEGDFDGDSDTDFADFLILSNNFGNSVLAAPTAHTVPEPESAPWIVCLFGWNVLRRRWARQSGR